MEPKIVKSNVRIKVWMLSMVAFVSLVAAIFADRYTGYWMAVFFATVPLVFLIKCENCGLRWAIHEQSDNDIKMFVKVSKTCPRCGVMRR